MIKIIIRASFLFVFLIFLSLPGLINFETIALHSTNQVMNSQKIPKSLNISPDYGRIPLYFIPNEGQVDERALFYAKTSRYTLWLTEKGLVFDSTRRIKKEITDFTNQNSRVRNNPDDIKYDRDVSRLIFKNANRIPEVIPVDWTEHKVNYLIGNDKSKWRSNIKTSRAVLYKELYPNIDLKVYGIEKQIEYDFIVKPGGEVSDIGFDYKDVEKTGIDDEGNLIVETEFGEIMHAKPLCYQVIEGERIEVKAGFKKIGDYNYGFKVKGYNGNYELIIDPVVLVYSTYLGGSGDDGSCRKFLAVDLEGAAYVIGDTGSFDFPTNSPIQGTNAGHRDVFIAKVNSSGSALIYSTYLGGSGGEGGSGIAVDSEGAAYVTGSTESENFPTKNAIQGSFGGAEDAFIAKVNSSGSALIYSTYLGGSRNEGGEGITVDSEGAAYVTGTTGSGNFPTQNSIQGTNAGATDAFITKVNSSGSALIYSTYLGGSGPDYGYGIGVDSEGAAYVTGDTNSTDFPTQNPIQGSFEGGTADVFIVKLNSSGNTLVYSTYLGGSREDFGKGIAVDSESATYVTGWTTSIDFPTQSPIQRTNAGGYEAFIIKLNSSGNAIIYSTYLGGSGDDLGFGIGVDSEGAVYVTGSTWSVNFPTKNAIQSNFGGAEDAFIAKVNSSGSALVYSTYLGGSDGERAVGIGVDSEGAAYVTGFTGSMDFPTQNPIQGSYGGKSDAFIAKIGSSETIRVVSWNILNYTGLNEEYREEQFRRILGSLAPDILVVQEITSAFAVIQFRNKVLNHKPPRKYRSAKFFDGPDTDNALFYNKSKLKLISPRRQIPTSLRDISEYTLKIIKDSGHGNTFKIFSVHFADGIGAAAKKKRVSEAETLRTYLNGLLPDDLFLVCGTFNMRSSQEKAFKILSGGQVNNIGKLKDPMYKPGKWHDKNACCCTHTESTRKRKLGVGVGGGLDDRYDMILISSGLEGNENLIVRLGSCCVFGNDSKHLNMAINVPLNKAVSAEIADALYIASDHLPVIIELVPKD